MTANNFSAKVYTSDVYTSGVHTKGGPPPILDLKFKADGFIEVVTTFESDPKLATHVVISNLTLDNLGALVTAIDDYLSLEQAYA